MDLDFSPLASAISQLEKALSYANSPLALADPGVREQFRNSVIRCFEFTYELSHKMLKRYLEERAANPSEIGAGSFQEIIRIGSQQGLLRSDWGRWKAFRQARTDSSHTYDENKAKAVFDVAPEFLQEAFHLLRELRRQGGLINAGIDLPPASLAEVIRILQTHVPVLEVWAFGSRVKGTAKPYSDLDLAVLTEQPMPLELRADLSDAFDESALPIRVDIVDWAATNPAFRKIIELQRVVIQAPAPRNC